MSCEEASGKVSRIFKNAEFNLAITIPKSNEQNAHGIEAILNVLACLVTAVQQLEETGLMDLVWMTI